MKTNPSIPACIEILEARIAPAAVAAINLGGLDGTDGFKLSGIADGDRSGISVSHAGDVNGDGFADVIIGAYSADEGGDLRGASYVVFGKVGGFPAGLVLSELDGANGFKLSGLADIDHAGFSVSDAGDVNGDGLDDLIIGAYGAAEGGNARGASYVVFGRRFLGAGLPSVDLSTLDGTDGFKLSGVVDFDNAGRSVSTAGDINGDGFADLIIGAPRAGEGGALRGASYVVFGKADFSGTASLSLSALDGTNGFKLSGVADEDFAGGSVGGAGDVNGDGFDDLIIGASGVDAGGGNLRGASYVVFGRAGGFGASVALSGLDGTNGFKLSGVENLGESGHSVSGAGDVNGDGFDDVIIGARGADEGGLVRGASYVVFGKAGGFGASVALSGLNGTNGFKLSGVADVDGSGNSVSGAGDVNGDGFDDLIIGATGANEGGSDRGASYVIFGKAAFSTTAGTLALSGLDGTNGFKLSGAANDNRAGRSVSAAGDVNGDGFDDLIIGAKNGDGSNTDRGASYVVFGFNSGRDITNDPGVVTIAANGKSATFTDVDGDIVTVKITKGELGVDNFTLLHPLGAVANGAQLVGFNCQSGLLPGTDLSITAKRGPLGGDGRVNVGFIDSHVQKLAKVTIAGDLGRIDGPSANFGIPGIASLTVQSLGRLDTSTQDTGASLTSLLGDGVGKMTILGDVVGASLSTDSLGKQKIGSLSIGGSIIGGEKIYQRGRITAHLMGSVKVGGSVVGGSVVGIFFGSGIIAADIFTGPITIGGSLIGGAGANSGIILGFGGKIPTLSIGGSVIGGAGSGSGRIDVGGLSLLPTTIGKITIGGDLAAGTGNASGAINVLTTLDSLTIKGSMRGLDADHRAIVFVDGASQANPAASIIKAITIGGSVSHSQIRAGFTNSGVPMSIGKVRVAGDWVASDLAAGVTPGADGLFGISPLTGLSDDVKIASGATATKIASVIIGGQVLGTRGGIDHFAFTAAEIGAFTVGGTKLPLTRNAGTDVIGFSLGVSGDVIVREVI